jgi:glycosyltransferase involved in cell wall biosynthesis
MPPTGRRVLYISYDGVLEPLGESQVVAYLERLSDTADITLLSFEKPADLADAGRVRSMRERLERARIAWVPRQYHKRPPVLSTAFDIAAGYWTARSWARRTRHPAPSTPHPTPNTQHPTPGIVHARGYVPALIALFVKRAYGARFLFDMRGFWVDEKVDAGHWPRGGLLYRVGKWCERRFFGEADAIVSLTAAGIREFPRLGNVRTGVPIVVIPTCADLDRFAPGPPDAAQRSALGLDGSIVVGCVGTLSNWYLRQDTLAYLAWLAKRTDRMKALIVTRDDHDLLRADAARAGLPPERLVVVRASFDEVPALMRLMDAGVFFIRVCFSKRASAATKLAEFLGCGVPVVINDGIGDSGDAVRDARAGVVLGAADMEQFERTAEAFDALVVDPEAGARCRALAIRDFGLATGVARYAKLYAQLT